MNRKLFLMVIVLLAAMALPASWATAAPSAPAAYAFPIPDEPNDTLATANDAWSGYLMTVNDVDYIRVPLDRPTHVELEVEIWNHASAPVLRVQLAFYDATGNLLAEDAGCDEQALVNADVPAGLYIARVQACPAAFDADQRYTLAETGYHRPIEWEPNDSRATANVFDDVDATIAPAGDVDYYRFEGAAGETWYASLAEWGGTFVPEMALLDASGAVLATSGPGYLYYDLTATGVYYFRVRSASHPTGTGNYRIYGGVYPQYTSPGDVEPNDTPAQAVPVVYGDRLVGEIADETDVDFYRFTGQAGDEVALPLSDVSYRWGAVLALYDPAMNPVTLNGGYFLDAYWGTLPTDGVYSLKVFNPDAVYGESYGFSLVLTGGDEPNNTMATATDVSFGPVLAVNHDYLCDTDWFRFQGRAGDVLAKMNTNVATENVFLYDANGARLNVHILPADGVYYLEVLGNSSDKWDVYCEEGPVDYSFGQALWVSAAVDKLGGDAAIKRGDIATRKTAAGQWQIVFDASDVGITQNVNAFEALPNGSILMTLAGPQTVPGLGKVMPQDIIRFNPTALGDNTAGTFEWFLDGSDVGLTTSGEKIDAISMQRDIEHPLRISLSGAGSVPRESGGTLKVADEDVINFVGTAYGATSAGNWRMSLDGSTVAGMASEDVSGMARIEMYPAHDSQTLLSFDSAFKIAGQKGGPLDVLIQDTWLPAVQRLTDKKIDGLSVGLPWTP